MTEIAERLSRGSVYVFASIVAIKILNLITSLVIARLLGPRDFGLYSILFALQNVVILVAGFGAAPVVTKYIAEHRVSRPKLVGAILSTSLLSALCFSVLTSSAYFLMSDFIANEIYGQPILVPLIRLAAVAILTTTMISIGTSTLQGFQSIQLLSKLNVFNALVRAALAYLIISQLSLLGVAACWIAGGVIFLAILGKVVLGLLKQEGIHLGIQMDGEILRKIAYLALPSLLSGVAVAVALWFAKTHLALAVSLSHVGFYQVADSLNRVVLFIPLAVGVPLLPVVSELQARDRAQLSRTASQVLKASASLTLPAALSLGLMSRFALVVLFGEKYQGAWEITYTLSMAVFLMSMGSIIGTVLTGSGKMWQALGFNCLWMLSFVSLSWVLVYSHGLNGLGWAYVASYIVHTIVLFTYASKTLGIRLEGLRPLLGLAIIFFLIGNLVVRTYQGTVLIAISGLMVAALLGLEYFFLSRRERDSIAKLLRKTLSR